MAAKKPGGKDGGGGSDMAKVFEALEQIASRLDRLEGGLGYQTMATDITQPDLEKVGDTATAAAAQDNSKNVSHQNGGKTLN
jgi:hypothetical protein